MFSRRFGFALALAVLLGGALSAVACGSSSKSSTPTPGMTMAPAATGTKSVSGTTTPQGAATPGATGTAGTQAAVTIKDFEFAPASVTVLLGGTVTWTNNGPSTHTVTADDGSFDSGNLTAGKTFSHTFQTAGTFAYHCTIHPFMTGQVIVQSGASATGGGY